MATPKRLSEIDILLILKKRLEKCWELDIDWSLYPSFLKKVIAAYRTILSLYID